MKATVLGKKLAIPITWLGTVLVAALPYLFSFSADWVTDVKLSTSLFHPTELLFFTLMTGTNALSDLGRFREQAEGGDLIDLRIHWYVVFIVIACAAFILGILAFSQRFEPKILNQTKVLTFSLILALSNLTACTLAQSEMVQAEESSETD